MNSKLIWKTFCNSAVTLAALGSVMPMSAIARAGEPAVKNESSVLGNVRVLKNATALDVQLKNGAFHGRVVDHSGKAIEGAAVEVRQGKTVVAKTVTTNDGKFSADNMKGGMYTVSVGQTSGNYRMWTEGTAPEGTADRGLVVMGENGTRGQTYVWDPVTMSWVAVALGGAALGTAIYAADEAQEHKTTVIIVTP